MSLCNDLENQANGLTLNATDRTASNVTRQNASILSKINGETVLLETFLSALHLWVADVANDRGIPTGYLNRLEARLAATEVMLFSVLQRLPGARPLESLPQMPHLDHDNWQPRRIKGDLVREWDALPLRTLDDLEAWYQSKSLGSSVLPHRGGLVANSTTGASPGPTPSEQWPGTSDAEASNIDTDFTGSPTAQTGDFLPMIGGSSQVQAEIVMEGSQDQSKTHALLRREENLYF